MKVVLVNNFFSPEGGAELSSFSTLQLLEQHGHEVCFFATDRKPYFIEDYPYSRFFPPYQDYDNQAGLWDKLGHIPGVFYNPEAEQQLDQLLTLFKPDIVHCNNLYYHLTPSILKACQRHKVPVAMTLRDVRMMCPAGTLRLNAESYCQKELCVGGSALNCVTHRCYNKSLSQSVLVTAEFQFRKFQGLFNTVSRFITPSQALADLGIRAGVPAEKLAVVPNFIEDRFFEEAFSDKPGEYFLYAGRLSKEKGVQDILTALAGLPREIPLHIVGTGPDETDLKALCETHGLTNVVFRGFLSGQDLVDAYRGCIASIIPANWFEVFGRTIVETFALGRPVIGSAVGGIPEIIEPGVNGYLIPPGDQKTLQEAMRELYENPELASQMSRNARQKAEREYRGEVHLKRLLQVYEQVVAG